MSDPFSPERAEELVHNMLQDARSSDNPIDHVLAAFAALPLEEQYLVTLYFYEKDWESSPTGYTLTVRDWATAALAKAAKPQTVNRLLFCIDESIGSNDRRGKGGFDLG